MQRIAACGSAWLERLLDAFSPPSCAACGGPRRGPPPFCITCGAPAPLLLPATLGGVPLVVAGRYQAPLSKAVQRFKFEGRSELATDLARLLVPRLRALELGDACFVPVPLHRARLVERGYNQSALLARCLARGVGGMPGCGSSHASGRPSSRRASAATPGWTTSRTHSAHGGRGAPKERPGR
jgi:predicted amidophosphoribosyltransferase